VASRRGLATAPALQGTQTYTVVKLSASEKVESLGALSWHQACVVQYVPQVYEYCLTCVIFIYICKLRGSRLRRLAYVASWAVANTPSAAYECTPTHATVVLVDGISLSLVRCVWRVRERGWSSQRDRHEGCSWARSSRRPFRHRAAC
jgi:ribosomal protein S26